MVEPHLLFAIDENGNRVHIKQAVRSCTYFCELCNTELTPKKGKVRAHHFAHKVTSESCKQIDSWFDSYDMSEWHRNFQELFPEPNQEVVLKHDGQIHRADVLVDRTVIEFQHSPLSMVAFNDRNAFYVSHGYRVIWVFDLTEESLYFAKQTDKSYWVRWKKAFTTLDMFNFRCPMVQIFFHLTMFDTEYFVQVDKHGKNGYCDFHFIYRYGREKFLKQRLLLKGDETLPPDKANELYSGPSPVVKRTPRPIIHKSKESEGRASSAIGEKKQSEAQLQPSFNCEQPSSIPNTPLQESCDVNETDKPISAVKFTKYAIQQGNTQYLKHITPHKKLPESLRYKFGQQTEQVRDEFDQRWIQCEWCHDIKLDVDFATYGGVNRVNLGYCSECYNKKYGRQ